MQTATALSLRLLSDLKQALQRNQLTLHYQPQMDLRDGRLVGAEALLRWTHPELGNISPAQFIPIAESSGLIIPIGEWVLRTAALQAKAWLDAGLPPLLMAVNLSAVQFRHVRLIDTVVDILEQTGLPADALELELTEAVAMDDPLGAMAVMDALHQRGVHMSIDDFGTGYSSLSYLKRFKVSKLKIDQSFVRDIHNDPDDQAIVSAIINMARSLGMQTIAEGVETEEQRTFLRANGCGQAQGYLFSRPVPAAAFEAFARGRLDLA
jgi:EAL domain-containing protein (putative c-di-GMP-specific phosphodiesterase class I)